MQTRGKDAEHECGQNRALIADDRDRNAEDVHRERYGIARRNRICIRQLGCNEHKTEHDADDGRTAEAVHRRPANERGQERKRRIGENLAHAEQIVAHLDTETLRRTAQPHEKTRGNEHGDNRNEHVAERARDLLQRRHLIVRLLLAVHRAHEIRARDECVEHLVDEARAEDDLVLCGSEKLPLHAVDVLDRLLVDDRLVVHDEAQTRRTVLGTADIARAADVLPDELCDALLLRQIRIDVIVRRSFRRRCFLGRCFLGRLITARGDLRIIECERDFSKVRCIRHEHGCRCLIPLRADCLGIELKQQLSALYRIPLRDMRRKMLALELHRIHTDMDEEIHPVRRVNADGMLRTKEHRDLAVHRRHHTPLGIGNSRTAPHRTARERRIRHLRKWDQTSLERTVQTNVLHIKSPL